MSSISVPFVFSNRQSIEELGLELVENEKTVGSELEKKFREAYLFFSGNKLYYGDTERFGTALMDRPGSFYTTLATVNSKREAGIVRDGILYFIAQNKLVKMNEDSENEVLIQCEEPKILPRLFDVVVNEGKVTSFVALSIPSIGNGQNIVVFDRSGQIVKSYPVNYDWFFVQRVIQFEGHTFVIESLICDLVITMLNTGLQVRISEDITVHSPNNSRETTLQFKGFLYEPKYYISFTEDNNVLVTSLEDVFLSMINEEVEHQSNIGHELLVPIMGVNFDAKMANISINSIVNKKGSGVAYIECNYAEPFLWILSVSVKSLFSYTIRSTSVGNKR